MQSVKPLKHDTDQYKTIAAYAIKNYPKTFKGINEDSLCIIQGENCWKISKTRTHSPLILGDIF